MLIPFITHTCRQGWGIGPIVVSNDQLRDHKAGTALPKIFNAWTSTHVAEFELQHAISHDRPVPFVMVEPPPKYVAAISRSEADSRCWHVPGVDSVPGALEWLCLTLPQ